MKECSFKTSRRSGDTPCSPSPAAWAILSGREVKHAAEAGVTPSSPQPAPESGPAASPAAFAPAEMLPSPSGLGQLHEQQAGLELLPGSKRQKVGRVGAAWLPDLLLFFGEGGGGVRGNLDCHAESCITCNLSIDRITLDWKVNLFCIEKL